MLELVEWILLEELMELKGCESILESEKVFTGKGVRTFRGGSERLSEI